jgi:hypothetical protein
MKNLKIIILCALFLCLFSANGNEPDKFRKPYKFEDFKVSQIFDGNYAKLNFKSNPNSKRFKTRISSCYDEPINFAGHFIICWWGCGSPCQSMVLIDAVSGKIFDGIISSTGYEYHVDSKLLILPAADSNMPFLKQSSEYYLWQDTAFIKLEL